MRQLVKVVGQIGLVPMAGSDASDGAEGSGDQDGTMLSVCLGSAPAIQGQGSALRTPVDPIPGGDGS